MAWRHGPAIGPEYDPLQQGRGLGPAVSPLLARVLFQYRMGLIPDVSGNYGSVLAGIGIALVHRFAEISSVVEDPIEETLVDRLAPFGPEAFGTQAARKQGGRAYFEELLKY